MNKNKSKSFVNYLVNLDRRVVYIFIFLAVALPFFIKPIVSIKTTKWVQSTYDLMEEAAKNHKPILIGFDYDPSTLAEIDPMAKALLKHAFEKNIKVVGINFIPNGTALAAMTMDEIAKQYGKTYGQDYVFLGYLPQYTLVLLNLGENLRKSYKTDYRGTDVNQVPMLQNIQNYNDFHLVICLSGTNIPEVYITYGVTKYNFNYIAGVTAVSAASYYPYLHSGQMKGLLAGMKGAAEYEGMIGKISDGMKGMASQSWGHLAIIFFIVVGNILYFVRKKSADTKAEEKS